MNPRVILALLLLGVFLGPATGLLNDAVLRALAPVLALALGWIGAAFGTRLQWRVIHRIPRPYWRLAAVRAGATFVAVAAGATLLALAVPALRAAWRPLVPVALALGAIAAVSGPGSVRQMLETAFGVVAFALALAIDHPRGPLPGPLGAGAWLVLALGCGVLVGVLFLGLARLREPQHVAMPLLGTVLFGAGVGYAADLSPFLVCAVAAAVMAHRSPERHAVTEQLRAWEPTINVIFLVLAGALLGLRTLWIVPAALLLLGVRIGARWAAVRFGRRLLGVTPAPRPEGSLSGLQGGVALALGINFLLIYRGSGAPAANAVFTTVAIGVVVAQLVAPFLVELTASPAPAEVS